MAAFGESDIFSLYRGRESWGKIQRKIPYRFDPKRVEPSIKKRRLGGQDRNDRRNGVTESQEAPFVGAATDVLDRTNRENGDTGARTAPDQRVA